MQAASFDRGLGDELDIEYQTVLDSASWLYREAAFSVIGEIIEELSKGVAGGGAFGRRDGPTPGAVSCRRGEDAWKARKWGEDAWKPGQYGNTSLSDDRCGSGLRPPVWGPDRSGNPSLTARAHKKDADQIYPGWKEKLTYTGESTVQAASVTSRPRDCHSEHPALSKDRVRSLFLSDGVIEFARTYEEIKGAFLTFQKDADQIFPGWKEKLTYTSEPSVQAASFDWAKPACVAPAKKEGCVASQALDQSSRYADRSLDEAASIRNGKHLPVDSNALFDRGKFDFNATSHAYKEFLDKGGTNEIINDKPVDESIYEETYLNVMGYADMKQKAHLVFASFFPDRVIPYRHDRGFEHEEVQLCATCQMMRSETGSADAMFSLDIESGLENVDVVISAYALGEAVVGGTVNPDEWYVFKPTTVQARPETVASRKKVDVNASFPVYIHLFAMTLCPPPRADTPGCEKVATRDIYRMGFEVFHTLDWCLLYLAAVILCNTCMCLGRQMVEPTQASELPKKHYGRAIHMGGYVFAIFIAMVYAGIQVCAHLFAMFVYTLPYLLYLDTLLRLGLNLWVDTPGCEKVGVRDIYRMVFEIFWLLGWCLLYLAAAFTCDTHIRLGCQQKGPAPALDIPKKHHCRATHMDYVFAIFIAVIYASFPVYTHLLANVGVPMPGGSSITSHAHKEFLDKGGMPFCPPPYLLSLGTLLHLRPNLFGGNFPGCETVAVRDIYRRMELEIFHPLGWCIFYLAAVTICSTYMCLGWQTVEPIPALELPKQRQGRAIHMGYASFPVYTHLFAMSLCPSPYLLNLDTPLHLKLSLFWVATQGCERVARRDIHYTEFELFHPDGCLFYLVAVIICSIHMGLGWQTVLRQSHRRRYPHRRGLRQLPGRHPPLRHAPMPTALPAQPGHLAAPSAAPHLGGHPGLREGGGAGHLPHGGDETDKVKKGDAVTVPCAEGDTDSTYKGELKFDKGVWQKWTERGSKNVDVVLLIPETLNIQTHADQLPSFLKELETDLSKYKPRYAVVGFGGKTAVHQRPHIVTGGGKIFGGIKDVQSAIANMKFTTEAANAFEAIEYLAHIPFLPGASKIVIMITDQNREATSAPLEKAIKELDMQGVIFNVIGPYFQKKQHRDVLGLWKGQTMMRKDKFQTKRLKTIALPVNDYTRLAESSLGGVFNLKAYSKSHSDWTSLLKRAMKTTIVKQIDEDQTYCRQCVCVPSLTAEPVTICRINRHSRCS